MERDDSTEAGILAPILLVDTTTLYFEAQDSCVTNVNVELLVNLYATLPYSPTEAFGEFVLASRGRILSSNPSGHGQRIKDLTFDAVEQIALAIRVANQ